MEIVTAVEGRNGIRVFKDSKGNEIGQGVRPIKSGREYDKFIKTSNAKLTSSFSEGGVSDTVNEIRRIIKAHHFEVSELAEQLKRASTFQTCKSVWDFVFHHIQYKRDNPSIEQLSTPARIWLNRSTPNTPSDCDDHTIFVGSLLYCLNIPFKIRIAGYDGNSFSHVYIIVNDRICLDTVLHRFNCEANYSSKQDYEMKIETLQGLHGQGNPSLNGMLGAVSRLKTSARVFEQKIAAAEGLGAIGDKEEEMALRNLGVANLSIALEQYEKDPEPFHAMGFFPAYWDHARLVLNELRSGTLEGIIVKLNDAEKYEQLTQMSPLNGLAGMGISQDQQVGMFGFLGSWFSRTFKKVTKAVGNGVKAVGKGIASGAKFVGKNIARGAKWTVKTIGKAGKWVGHWLAVINPLYLIIRGGMQLAVKKNYQNLAMKMGFSLLSESQAVSAGASVSDWKQAKSAYSKFISKYKFFGGSEHNLKKTLASAWYPAARKEGYKVSPVAMSSSTEAEQSPETIEQAYSNNRIISVEELNKKEASGTVNSYPLQTRPMYTIDDSRVLRGELGVPAALIAKGAEGAQKNGSKVSKILIKALKFLKPVLDMITGIFKKKQKEPTPEQQALEEQAQNLYEMTPEEQAIYDNMSNEEKAENNLVIINTKGKESVLPAISSDATVSTAGMNKAGMIALLLVGGGLLYGANKKKNTNSTGSHSKPKNPKKRAGK